MAQAYPCSNYWSVFIAHSKKWPSRGARFYGLPPSERSLESCCGTHVSWWRGSRCSRKNTAWDPARPGTSLSLSQNMGHMLLLKGCCAFHGYTQIKAWLFKCHFLSPLLHHDLGPPFILQPLSITPRGCGTQTFLPPHQEEVNVALKSPIIFL